MKTNLLIAEFLSTPWALMPERLNAVAGVLARWSQGVPAGAEVFARIDVERAAREARRQAVGASVGVKSINELIALATKQPGKVFFSSAGAGSGDHMAVERFRLATGIKVQHVGFKGQSEAQIEVLAGRVHFMYTGLTSSLPFIKDGKFLALAVTRKVAILPDVPAMSDFVPGWSALGAQAILSPAGTPLAIRQQLSKEIARALNLPDVKERLEAVGFNIAPTTPEVHDRNLRSDIAIFSKIVKEAGLRPNDFGLHCMLTTSFFWIRFMPV